jgi:hypothetical protein
MALTNAPPRRIARPDLSFAYLMTGIALGCIGVSGILGSIFAPDLVTTGGSADIGYTHEKIPLAAYMAGSFTCSRSQWCCRRRCRGSAPR